MQAYIPSIRTQKNLKIIFEPYNTKDFYTYLKSLNQTHSDLVKSIHGTNTQKYYDQLTNFLPITSSSQDGQPLIEIINRMDFIPKKEKSSYILAGLKDFYSKEYTSSDFELATEIFCLNYLISKTENEKNSKIFELIDEALTINDQKEEQNINSLNRRRILIVNVSEYGHNSINPEHEKKAKERYKHIVELEGKLTLYTLAQKAAYKQD